MTFPGKRWFFAFASCLVFLAFAALPAAALTVTSAMPKGEVKDLTQITVRFDQPMRALGVAEQKAATAPLRLSVPGGKLPSGSFRWLDPYTLSYLFDTPVSYPLAVSASVPKGTVSLAGDTLEQAVSWKISTPPVRLTVHNHDHVRLPRKSAYFSLLSNYQLDMALLRAKTSATQNGKNIAVSISEAPPAHKGNSKQWTYLVKVENDLAPAFPLIVTVAGGVKAKDGGLSAGKFTAEIRVYDALRLVSWELQGEKKTEDGARNTAPEAWLALRFNNPVRYSDALRHIRVSPETVGPETAGPETAGPEAVAQERFSSDSTGSHVALPYVWQPRTTYTVTLQKGLRDEHGTTLAQGSVFTFTTGDYRPLAYFSGGADAVLETPVADIFPVTLRNTGSFPVTLRYIPWGETALAIMRDDSAPPHPPVSGSREATLTLDVTKRPNMNIREMLDIPKALGFSSANEMRGLVILEAEVPALKNSGRRIYKHLQVTNLGLAARLGEKSGLVWAASLTTGKVAKGASLRITDATGATLWKGETGASGTATLPGYAKLFGARFCIADSPDGMSVLDLGKYLVPASEKEYEKTKAGRTPNRVHVVAQMPLYQPGQQVNAVLLARRHTDFGKSVTEDFADWKAVPQTATRIEVRDRRNAIVHAAEGKTDAYGALPFSFTLSPSAEPGWYNVTATFDDEKPSSTYAFQVASFRPPDFKVDIASPVSQPVPAPSSEPLTATVSAVYFSGSPVKNGTVAMEVFQHETFFQPAKLRGYKTGPERSFLHYRFGSSPIARLTGTLNAEGTTSLALPAPGMEKQTPINVSLTATVTDAARLTTQGTAAFTLHPSEYYVGLRAPFIALPGREAVFHIKAATWDDKPLTGKTVSATAERAVREKGETKYTRVWERSLTLEKETGDSFAAVFATAGEYRITVTIKDDTGRENIAVTRVYVPGPGSDWVYSQPGRRLEFLHEDAVHQPGETARVILKNPFETATALVALERDGVLRSFVVEVTGAAPLLEIPLEKTDAPYMYATVTLIKGRTAPPPDSSAPEGAADMGAPAFAQGSLRLKVSGARETLAVSVTSGQKTYRPRETVKAEIRVTDGAGKGKKAQVTLLAVDERYLRAAGERTRYDPSTAFAEQFPSWVQGADLWRYILNRSIPVSLRARQGTLGAPMAAKASFDAALPGLGQGADEGDTTVRTNHTPLAFWLAAKETDDSGKLTVAFPLPDSITSYRIVAVAYDTKSAFAVGGTSVTATQPLQILSALPKFLTEGDTLQAAVLVQNTGAQRGEVTVTAKIAESVPGTLLETDAQILTLEPGESKRLSFPLRAGLLTASEGKILLDVTAAMRVMNAPSSGTEKDAVRLSLPVKPARPLTTVAAAGLLGENETRELPVKTPGNLDPRSKMTVTFAPSPASGVPLAAKQVVEYPWNCLEQRLSRAWARILRLRHGDLLGLVEDPADRQKVLEEFAALPSYQTGSGEFALWPGSGESGSGLFLTSYALLVNDAAKELGITMQHEAATTALGYVERQLRLLSKNVAKNVAQKKTGTNKTEVSESADAAALALRVLSLHKPEAAKELFPAIWSYCRKNETNPLGLASLLFVAHTAKTLPDAAETTAAIREMLEKTAAVTATETHFASVHEDGYWRTFGSRLRDNAYVLAALAETDPGYSRLESLARWVGQRLGDTNTLSTQEAAFGISGLASYLQTLGGDRETAITAVWNGKDEAGMTFKRLMDAPAFWVIASDKLNDGNDSVLRLMAKAGRPYWTARLSYASPETKVKAENAGFTITRAVTAAEGRSLLQANTQQQASTRQTSNATENRIWKIGDTVQVTLTVTVPAIRRHVVLFDPFPAGFEPLFATRVDVTAQQKAWQPPWWWQDALADGLLLYAPAIHPGTYTYTYTLRAVAGGSFIHRPAHVEEMYTPETFGRTAPGSVAVEK
ncbi:MAG: hypothetical protein DELT_01116 [Desulfovibrio sp.]